MNVYIGLMLSKPPRVIRHVGAQLEDEVIKSMLNEPKTLLGPTRSELMGGGKTRSNFLETGNPLRHLSNTRISLERLW